MNVSNIPNAIVQSEWEYSTVLERTTRARKISLYEIMWSVLSRRWAWSGL